MIPSTASGVSAAASTRPPASHPVARSSGLGALSRRARRGLRRYRHQPAVRAAGQPGACSHGIAITSGEVLGILSLIFWSLVLIVTVKYVLLVMRADNRGEGGILALMALAQRVSVGTRMRNTLGAGRHRRRLPVLRRRRDHAGDLGAVGGRGAGGLARRGLRSSCCRSAPSVIVVLFAVQCARHRQRSGALFGPVMVVWFAADRRARRGRDRAHPAVLLAISPQLRACCCACSTSCSPSWRSAPWCWR